MKKKPTIKFQDIERSLNLVEDALKFSAGLRREIESQFSRQIEEFIDAIYSGKQFKKLQNFRYLKCYCGLNIIYDSYYVHQLRKERKRDRGAIDLYILLLHDEFAINHNINELVSSFMKARWYPSLFSHTGTIKEGCLIINKKFDLDENLFLFQSHQFKLNITEFERIESLN